MKLSQHLTPVVPLTAFFLLLFTSGSSVALILVNHGNRPVENLGWPLGCEKVANLPGRLGYWEGPPFGGGEYHFEFRCHDTTEFNRALETFAAIQVPPTVRRSTTSRDSEGVYRVPDQALELVVHDGPEYSFWEVEETGEKEPVDWVFTVWKPANWHRLYNHPQGYFLSDHPNFRQPVPPPQIHACISKRGPIVWEEVKVPPDVRVIDQRAEAAPVQPVGGGLVCGTVYDLSTGQPIPAAQIFLAAHESPQEREEVIHGQTDDRGSFQITPIPSGRYEVRIRAPGYASLRQGSYHNQDTTYHQLVAELAREARIQGKVTDPDGKPIPGVEVSARNTLAINGWGYPCLDTPPVTTDGEGRFEIRSLPEGFTQVQCKAPSLHQVTSFFDQLYEVPVEFHDAPPDIWIIMTGTGKIRVQIRGEEGGIPREEVHVSIEPLGGARRGQWGGSGRCNEEGRMEFEGVPPDEYVVRLKRSEGPAPKSQLVTVQAGETVQVDFLLSDQEK